MAGRARSKTYDVLAVSSTVHKANADYLAGILRYASGRPDWRLWLLNPMADYSFGNVLPTRRASGVIVNGLDEVPLETLRPWNPGACVGGTFTAMLFAFAGDWNGNGYAGYGASAAADLPPSPQEDHDEIPDYTVLFMEWYTPDMAGLARHESAMRVLRGPLVLAKGRLAGTSREETLFASSLRGQG